MRFEKNAGKEWKRIMLCKCRICKKAFPSFTRVFSCEECRDADEKLFTLIEEYLAVYPNSNAIEISNALKIKTELIISYIDEGRLTYSKGHFEKIQ